MGSPESVPSVYAEMKLASQLGNKCLVYLPGIQNSVQNSRIQCGFRHIFSQESET